MKSVFLTVVIPCYNEEENLKGNVLGEVHDYLEKQKYSYEVIICDDGSTDRSLSLIKKQIKDWKYFKLVECKHAGKPATLLEGIKKAEGKYILFSDMDQSTPIDQVAKLIPHTQKRYRAIIGSRSTKRKNFPLYRKLGAVVFASFRKVFVLPDINDTQCGFKMFDRKLIEKVFPKLEILNNKAKGWTVSAYDVELLHILHKKGEKIKEVVVDWSDRDISTSKGGGMQKYFKESIDMVKQILRVKLNDVCGVYNQQ